MMGSFDKIEVKASTRKATSNLNTLQNLFCDGFPSSMKESIIHVADNIPSKTFRDVGSLVTEQKVTYCLDGDAVIFPYRVYFLEVEDGIISTLSYVEKMILHCIYSRSCDGYTREKHIKCLLSSDFPEWSIPYVVKVCDEYVVEILQVVYDSLSGKNTDKIKQFCVDNQDSFCRSYNRMISYWNAFYRCDCYRYENYIGRKLFMECFGAKRTMNCSK